MRPIWKHLLIAGQVSGGGAWTPAQFTGLQLWLDASDIATLYQDSAGTTPVTTNDHPVGKVNDKSGNSRHVIQATAGARPTYKAAGLNGRPTLYLDGGDSLTNTTAALLRGVSAWTIFAVFASNNSDSIRAVVFVDTGGGTARAFLGTTLTDKFMYGGGRRANADAFAFAATDNVALLNNKLYLAEVVASYTDTDASVYKDGTLVGTNTSWLTTGVTPNDGGGLYIGSNAAGAQLLRGHVAEIVILDHAATPTELQQWRTYAAAKWGYNVWGNLVYDSQIYTLADNQGLANDGTHLYETQSFELFKRDLADGDLVDSNDDLCDGKKMGGICYHDGYLYITAGTYTGTDDECFVYKVDRVTLDDVQHWDLSAHFNVGVNAIARVGDAWYIGETTTAVSGTRKWCAFDSSFVYIKDAFSDSNSADDNNNWEDAAVANGRIYALSHWPGYKIHCFQVNADHTLTRLYQHRTAQDSYEGITYVEATGKFVVWKHAATAGVWTCTLTEDVTP